MKLNTPQYPRASKKMHFSSSPSVSPLPLYPPRLRRHSSRRLHPVQLYPVHHKKSSSRSPTWAELANSPRSVNEQAYRPLALFR
jgi:hypothetical protein